MRHQHLLIRRLAVILRSRMSSQGHLLQAVQQEGRGNCLPPSHGCTAACREAQALVALTEPYMPTDAPARRPDVVIGRIPHLTVPKPARARTSMAPLQSPLFPEAV
jgi:hypothetical protein